MTPLLEVFVPVHNGAELIGRTLDSLLDAEGVEYSVIVLDNASTDDTRSVVERYDDERLSYRRFEEFVDLSASFNRCVEAASRQYFAIVHADDEVAAAFGRHLVAFAEQHPESAVYTCQVDLIDESGEKLETLKHRTRRRIYERRGPVLSGTRGIAGLASYNHLAAPAAIYRREAVQSWLRFDGSYRYITDQTVWLRLLMAGHSIRQSREVLYRHRVHEGQLSASLRASADTVDEIANFFRDLSPLAVQPRVRRRWLCYGLMFLARGLVVAARSGDSSALQELLQARRRLSAAYRGEFSSST